MPSATYWLEVTSKANAKRSEEPKRQASDYEFGDQIKRSNKQAS